MRSIFGAAHHIDGPSNFRKSHGIVATNEGDLLGTQLEYVFEPLTESVPRRAVFVDFQSIIPEHLNDDHLVGLFARSTFGGVSGIIACKPFGASGVITMKIMINTQRISINGITFMLAIGPLFLPPTSIPHNRCFFHRPTRFCSRRNSA